MKKTWAFFACSVLMLAGLSAFGVQGTRVGPFPQQTIEKFWVGEAGAPTSEISSLRECDGRVFAMAADGWWTFDGAKWVKAPGGPGCAARAKSSVTIPAGIPYDDVLSTAERDGVLWVGTSMGAARWDGKEWRYLEGKEYLADDRVIGTAILPDGSAWLAAAHGLTRVTYPMMTLSEKAAVFEKATRERHLRHGLVSDSSLERPGDPSSNRTRTSDNDGLWTAMYIAAECFRYGATKDPEALEFARESLKAMMFLETVNEIPGFVSRSFALPDEPHGEGEWDHLTSDGKWRWKGDTSSDEIVGHYYAYSIYYDICADAKEKEEIKEKVRLITDYILDHDLYLIDTDGRPTTWGKWNFKGFNRFRFWARGLNSLEILSHLKAAYHVTGDQKYQDAYLDLAVRHDYAKFTVRQKLTFPPSVVNHSDDELAFLSYYPLLKYEDDPKLRKIYEKSITRSWKIEEPEKCPLWDFIYGAVGPKGADFDLEGALFTLERISLDLVEWDHVNSRRKDIEFRHARGRFDELESKEVLPPDERKVMKWNGNPYRLDDGRHGKSEEAGTFWLLPYWMGRYYGFIVED